MTLCCHLSSPRWLKGSSTLHFKGEAGILVVKSFLNFYCVWVSTIIFHHLLKKTGQLSMAKVGILLGIFHHTSWCKGSFVICHCRKVQSTQALTPFRQETSDPVQIQQLIIWNLGLFISIWPIQHRMQALQFLRKFSVWPASLYYVVF